jgi:hypothetical protein
MYKRKPEGHPVVVMAVGGFIGGLVAGGNNTGFIGFAVLSIGVAFGLLAAFGHVRKDVWDAQLGTVIGLSTVIPMPVGFLGLILGKALWGTP